MEFSIMSKQGALPCEVTIDEENYRYTIRNADTTGFGFNTPGELVRWVEEHWRAEQFVNEEEYYAMLEQLQSYK